MQVNSLFEWPRPKTDNCPYPPAMSYNNHLDIMWLPSFAKATDQWSSSRPKVVKSDSLLETKLVSRKKKRQRKVLCFPIPSQVMGFVLCEAW